LSDEEIDEVDRWFRARAGEVRAREAVEPKLLFELHFEAIARSTRHKSRLAVRGGANTRRPATPTPSIT
jgi:DNA ligase-1